MHAHAHECHLCSQRYGHTVPRLRLTPYNRECDSMTLEDYLDHLTEENWHTLRELIELERGNLTN